MNERKRTYAVDARFSAARKAVTQGFENASQMATATGLARDTCYDLFNADIDDAFFTRATQLKVMAYGQTDVVLAQQLRRTMAAGDDEYGRIAEYEGRYLYYRYNVQSTKVSGSIIIERRDGVWIAKHYNHGFEQHGFDETRPDHEGFVYIVGDRLHIVGIGHRYFRPIVANTVKSVAYDYIRGVVISVNQSGGLFAASFVMVHQTHAEFKKPNKEHYFDLIAASNRLSGVLVPNA